MRVRETERERENCEEGRHLTIEIFDGKEQRGGRGWRYRRVEFCNVTCVKLLARRAKLFPVGLPRNFGQQQHRRSAARSVQQRR